MDILSEAASEFPHPPTPNETGGNWKGLWASIQPLKMPTFSHQLSRYDMHRKSKMQGGKKWIFPKEINANWLSLAGNLEKPLHMSLYGTEWKDRGYGLRFEK
jgi:hypothetical protein